MSGLSKDRPEGNFNFVNIKDGKLVARNDAGQKDSYESLTGFVKSLDVTDEEYNGKAYRKIVLFVVTKEGVEYRFGFPLESGYGNAFCCFSPNLDFKKEITFSAGVQELDNGKKYGKLFAKQEGKNIKWYFTKDNEAGKKLPQGEQREDRNGPYTDMTKRNDYFYKMLVDPKKSIFQTIKKAWNYEPAKPKQAAPTDADNVTVPMDDLPF